MLNEPLVVETVVTHSEEDGGTSTSTSVTNQTFGVTMAGTGDVAPLPLEPERSHLNSVTQKARYQVEYTVSTTLHGFFAVLSSARARCESLASPVSIVPHVLVPGDPVPSSLHAVDVVLVGVGPGLDFLCNVTVVFEGYAPLTQGLRITTATLNQQSSAASNLPLPVPYMVTAGTGVVLLAVLIAVMVVINRLRVRLSVANAQAWRSGIGAAAAPTSGQLPGPGPTRNSPRQEVYQGPRSVGGGARVLPHHGNDDVTPLAAESWHGNDERIAVHSEPWGYTQGASYEAYPR